MSRKLRIVLTVGLFLATAAGAQAGNCMLGGKEYPENTQVCSGGLVTYCSNGTWQSNSGARCDAPTGSYLGARRPFEERNNEPVPQYYKDKYPGLNLQ